MTSENTDKELEKKLTDVQRNIADTLRRNLDIPVYEIDHSVIDSTLELLKGKPVLQSNFSDEELRKEISAFFAVLPGNPPKDPNDFENRFESFVKDLQREKEYEAFIIFPELTGLPVGKRIGPLAIIKEPTNKKELYDFLEWTKERKRLYLKDRSWGKVSFKTHRTIGVREILFDLLELPCAALYLLMYLNLDLRKLVGAIYAKEGKRICFLEPQIEATGWSRYVSANHEKKLNILSAILKKANPTKLEKKILQATQVFWLSSLTHKREIRFLMLIAAFESLLLTKNDRDYLGKKLAEKASFLIETEFEKRIELYKLLKRFYGKRSALVHGEGATINETEERQAEGIYRKLIFKVLELTEKYDRMEQKSPGQETLGLEDYINELKFT